MVASATLACQTHPRDQPVFEVNSYCITKWDFVCDGSSSFCMSRSACAREDKYKIPKIYFSIFLDQLVSGNSVRHERTGTSEILIVQRTEAYVEAGFLAACLGCILDTFMSMN